MTQRARGLALLAAALVMGGTAEDLWAHAERSTLHTNRYSSVVASPESLLLRHFVAVGDMPGLELRRRMDTNHDGRVSPQEATAQARRLGLLLQRCLRIELGGHALRPQWTLGEVSLGGQDAVVAAPVLLDWRWAPERFAPGDTDIRLEDDCRLPEQGQVELRIEAEPGSTLLGLDVPVAMAPDSQTFVFEGPDAPKPTALFRVGTAGPGAAPEQPSAAPAPAARPLATTPALDGEARRLREALAGELSIGLVLFALGLALVLGAAHALSPGHGKTLVAAYLVGTRGKARHAFLLGAVVTLTHVSSVILLGLGYLVASRYVLPGRLMPWLGVASGLLVLGIGILILVRRSVAAWDGHGHHHHAHEQGHPHHEHGHPHHEHGHPHHEHGHPHREHEHEGPVEECSKPSMVRRLLGHRHPHTTHADGRPVSYGELLLLGISGGIVPCPTAMVVLLSAIALGRVVLGLAMILSFSVGLAGVLIVLGLLVVRARSAMSRLPPRLLRVLPLASAVAVTVLGALLTLHGLGEAGVLRLHF